MVGAPGPGSTSFSWTDYWSGTDSLDRIVIGIGPVTVFFIINSNKFGDKYKIYDISALKFEILFLKSEQVCKIGLRNRFWTLIFVGPGSDRDRDWNQLNVNWLDRFLDWDRFQAGSISGPGSIPDWNRFLDGGRFQAGPIPGVGPIPGWTDSWTGTDSRLDRCIFTRQSTLSQKQQNFH